MHAHVHTARAPMNTSRHRTSIEHTVMSTRNTFRPHLFSVPPQHCLGSSSWLGDWRLSVPKRIAVAQGPSLHPAAMHSDTSIQHATRTKSMNQYISHRKRWRAASGTDRGQGRGWQQPEGVLHRGDLEQGHCRGGRTSALCVSWLCTLEQPPLPPPPPCTYMWVWGGQGVCRSYAVGE